MDEETVTQNGAPQEDAAQHTLAQRWCERVRTRKASPTIKSAFDRMKEDMKFANGLQWSGQVDHKDPRYVANIAQRHVKQRVAALYAKNPTVVAKRRQTLDFAIWDGNPQTVAMAQQTLAMAMQTQADALAAAGDPNAMAIARQAQQARALLGDYQSGMQRRNQLDRIAKSLEVVWTHQVGEQLPPFKHSLKRLVNRTVVTGVGYLKLGYHRFIEYRPEDVQRVTDLTEQVAALEASLAEMQEGDESYEADSAELAELRTLLERVRGEQEAFMREGLDFDFPRATSLIPGPGCYQLNGFLGASWVAQEFLLTPKQVREIYRVDINTEFRHYSVEGEEISDEALQDVYKTSGDPECRALVWEIYDKHSGTTLTVCDGHREFLVKPKVPDIKLERFWPFFVLTFNELENEKEIFPLSDVRLLRSMQTEINISRQRLREHRDAARPGHAAPKGRLDQQDKGKLENREAHDVVELNGLNEQDDIRRILQPIPTNPIDPNLYEVGTLQDDVYKVVGTQEAVLGGASGATATETSIAESSRLSSIGSAVDELDDFLTELARFASHILLSEMSAERAQEIAGRGAIWPELSGADVAQDLWLEVRAGSSGRPNKAAEIQNLERVMPFLLQIPGLKPERILREVLDRLDDRLAVEDFYDPMLPSLTAQNRQAQVGTGDPTTDPNDQGGEGGDKTAVESGDSNMGPRPPAEARNMDPNRM